MSSCLLEQLHGRQDILLICLHYTAVHEHLVYHKMRLRQQITLMTIPDSMGQRGSGAHHLEVEHQVQLAYVAEEAVQRLYQAVNEFQCCEFILRLCTRLCFRQAAENQKVDRPERTSSSSTPTRKKSEAYRL